MCRPPKAYRFPDQGVSSRNAGKARNFRAPGVRLSLPGPPVSNRGNVCKPLPYSPPGPVVLNTLSIVINPFAGDETVELYVSLYSSDNASGEVFARDFGIFGVLGTADADFSIEIPSEFLPGEFLISGDFTGGWETVPNVEVLWNRAAVIANIPADVLWGRAETNHLPPP